MAELFTEPQRQNMSSKWDPSAEAFHIIIERGILQEMALDEQTNHALPQTQIELPSIMGWKILHFYIIFYMIFS
jgi:hypothetical protein